MPDLATLDPIFRVAWLVPGIPLLSILLLGLVVRPRSQRACGWIGTLAIFLSAVLATKLAWEYFTLFPAGSERPAIVPWSFDWLPFMSGLSAKLGVLVDPLSLLLMVVVTWVSTLVHLYSIGYMHGEDGYGRYFTELNLFTFSMLGLVVAPNIVQMFVCWELVGVSSFLLIGFYYQRPAAVAAAKKAFVVTRFADLGFLVGMLMLGYAGYAAFPELAPQFAADASGAAAQPFDFAVLNHPAMLERLAAMSLFAGASTLTLALVLVFMGAAGKSAMFPLHIWLPDAMEGPTPVSALIHAATMVVAGVYLVARLFPAFAAAGDPLAVVAAVGAFTCLFAAVIACTQDDIKRVLAFSTLSQLGYMMFALGVATVDHPLGYTASLFHLFTHAFFKALLFLAAGAVIHAVHSNEIWDMGGLRRKLPVTHAVFLVANLAIAGLPPFSGFFSKDEILRAALENGHHLIFAVGLAVAALTAFYMFRVYVVTFWGAPRSAAAEKAHEAPAVMLVPLVILGVLSAVAGLVPMGDYVGAAHAPAEHAGIHWNIAVPATLAGLAGIGMAILLYAGGTARAAAITRAMSGVYTLVKRKFYVDEVYLFVTQKIIFRFVSAPIAWFDRHVVDGGVNLTGWITRTSGAVLAHLQTGQVQTYGAFWIAGAVVVLVLLWVKLGG